MVNKVPRKSSTSISEMHNLTSNPSSEPSEKPWTCVRKETCNPTSNPTSKQPRRASTDGRKETLNTPCNLTSNPSSELPGKPLTCEKRESQSDKQPKCNPISEPPSKLLLNVRKSTCNPTCNSKKNPARKRTGKPLKSLTKVTRTPMTNPRSEPLQTPSEGNTLVSCLLTRTASSIERVYILLSALSIKEPSHGRAVLKAIDMRKKSDL